MKATAAVTTVTPRSIKVIELSDVERSTRPSLTVDFSEAVHQYGSQKLLSHTGDPSTLHIEACPTREGLFLNGVYQHPFIEAVHRAFADHYPLVLSPQAIWLLIAQGFASHVDANSEALRPSVVGHHGKLELEVIRNDFVRGSPDNRWSEVFAEFAMKIRQNLKLGIYDLVVPRYSTTTDDDVAVTQVVLMESVKSYFDYMVTTLCGIPQIRLEGSADDWEKLLNDARALGRFDLQWWTGELVSVLEQFVAATNDNVDDDFWRSIYKYQDESGGPYVNGWINVFFPYLHAKAPRRRKFDVSSQVQVMDDAGAANHGASDIAARYENLRTVNGEFPTGLSMAPFTWNYLLTKLDMQFVGGFVGVRQEPETLALRPELGWLVVST